MAVSYTIILPFCKIIMGEKIKKINFLFQHFDYISWGIDSPIHSKEKCSRAPDPYLIKLSDHSRKPCYWQEFFYCIFFYMKTSDISILWQIWWEGKWSRNFFSFNKAFYEYMNKFLESHYFSFSKLEMFLSVFWRSFIKK